MTGLLSPASTRPSPRPAASPGETPKTGLRPVVLSACLAGVAAATAVLTGCMAVALAAWFATDQGGHGTTRDALRIGSDAWLLAHGSTLDVGVAVVTVLPLGLTVLCAYVAFRLGRWAGATSYTESTGALVVASLVLAAGYALVAIVVAVLASMPGAEPHLFRSFAGGFLVGLLAGGPGIAAGSGRLRGLTAGVPERLRAIAHAATAAVLVVTAAGGLLAATALLLDLGDAANVLSQLDAGPAGGALYTVLVAGFAPNAALFGAAYLVGPGFAVGTDTVVSTGEVSLGPVPAFPLLAALPESGPAPWWGMALLATPALAGLLAGALAVRAHPCSGYDEALLRGLGGGVLGGVLLALAMKLAGGAVGPGRMEQVGPDFVAPMLAGVVALGLGGAIGAAVTQWRQGPPPDGTEPTVDLSAGLAAHVAGPVPDQQPDDGASGDLADEPTVSIRRSLLSRVRRTGD